MGENDARCPEGGPARAAGFDPFIQNRNPKRCMLLLI